MNIKKIKIFNGATKEWVESILDVSEINKKADKTYVESLVNTEKTEREAADTEINNIVDTKADKTYVNDLVNTEKTEREAADTEINKIVNKKADITYVNDLVANTKQELLGTEELKEAYDTISEIAVWIENDTSGAAAMANEISKHNNILNGFGEEDEPSNIKEYVDVAIENINTNLETTINSLDEEGIKLKSDLYTYAPIGKIRNATDSNPEKVASAGQSLKDVFNAIFGETVDTEPTITKNITLSVSPSSTQPYGGGEYGGVVYKTTVNITFTLSNQTGTTNFGYKDIYGETHTDSFYYPIELNSEESQAVITLPTGKTANSNMVSTGECIKCVDNKLYCNFDNTSKTIVISIVLEESDNRISSTRYDKVSAEVTFGNPIDSNGNAITMLTLFGANSTLDYAGGSYSKQSGKYTITPGSKYTYYATTTSTNEPESWKKYGSGTTSVTDLTIYANAGEYIWIASASEYESIYAFNEMSGGYNTDKTATTKTSGNTLNNSIGVDVNGYYFYRTTNPMSLASENKYKLGNSKEE